MVQSVFSFTLSNIWQLSYILQFPNLLDLPGPGFSTWHLHFPSFLCHQNHSPSPSRCPLNLDTFYSHLIRCVLIALVTFCSWQNAYVFPCFLINFTPAFYAALANFVISICYTLMLSMEYGCGSVYSRFHNYCFLMSG